LTSCGVKKKYWSISSSVDKTGFFSYNTKTSPAYRSQKVICSNTGKIMTTKVEECTKLNMQDADAGKKLHNLKRRRKRERGNITGFITEVGNFTDTKTLEEYEYYKDRLHETLGRITSLDDEIHDLLDDREYDEEYIEYAKRAILSVSSQIEMHLATSTANVNH